MSEPGQSEAALDRVEKTCNRASRPRMVAVGSLRAVRLMARARLAERPVRLPAQSRIAMFSARLAHLEIFLRDLTLGMPRAEWIF